MSRCTGHCCRGFDLPFDLDTLDQLRLAYEAHPDLEPNEDKPDTWPDGLVYPEDGRQIVTMVIPLELGPRGQLFTCRNLDAAGIDCTAYDTRPAMCREFPYGRACPFDGCTLVSHG